MKPCRITFLIFLLLSLQSCLYDTSDKDFARAWAYNDTTSVRDYILQLHQKEVEEVGMIAESVLSAHTNFGYGMMYFYEGADGDFWDQFSAPERQIIKSNIISVWMTYTRSELFYKKSCQGFIRTDGELKSFHELYYPVRERAFSASEIAEIEQRMNDLARSCD